MLCDSHTHLNFKTFVSDAGDVIARALNQGVWLVNIGTQKDTSRQAVELAEKYKEGVYAAVGLHPIHLSSQRVDEEETSFLAREEEFDVAFYRQLAASKKVVALGETGLDFYRLPEDNKEHARIKAKQEVVFRQHISLAKELDLPLSIHCREAYADLARILREENFTAAVVHCFTGDLKAAKPLLELDLYLSFTGIITFGRKAAEIVEVVKYTPLDRLLVETDAPYLTPAPHRGQRNEPVYVKYVAEKVAEIKELTFDQVAERTFANTKRLFKL